MTDAISSISSVDVFEASTQSGFAILSISAENALLQLHALERRFDDQISLLETVVGELRMNERHPLVHHLLA